MDFLRDIPQFTEWRVVKPLYKGWSSDQKFYVERSDGQRLLLRLTDQAERDAKQREFEALQLFRQSGIRMSEPLEFGHCGAGQYVYSLLSWLEGDAADDVIQRHTEQEQYQLGLQAGRILRRIHSQPAPPDQAPWEQRMLRKFQVRLERYRNCGVQVEDDQVAMRFVTENLSLLNNRPQALQHGDYHLGNMILGADGQLGIIDFNRWDFGDPYEDFYKMLFFSRDLSIPFAQGQLDGYFQADPPDLFLRLLALYAAYIALFSVVWALDFGQAEVDGMIRRAEMLFRDYQRFSVHRPAWVDQPFDFERTIAVRRD